MFVRPENWSTLTPDERRQARYASWMSTEGRNFSNPEAEKVYRRNTRRVVDVMNLEVPDAIPILPFIGGYLDKYAGITSYEAMYDFEKYKQGARKFSLDFGLDYTIFSGSFNSGRVFDILDMKTYSWPGRGSHPRDRAFQVLEAEFMKGDEYDALIADPEGFYLHTYMPRAFGALAGLGMLSTAWATTEMPSAPFFLVPFGLPEGQKALQALLDAGREALNWATALEDMEGGILRERGLPRLPGGFTKAPFDFIGDTLRGTQGILTDMYRQPEKVLEALDRLVPFAVKLADYSASANNNPFAFIPLHKGADDFMSDKNFRRFYWPSHLKVVRALINEGLVPYHFVEGRYNNRLDVLADSGIPPRSTFWSFDQADMVQAKKKVGSWGAIGGNVQGSILYAGTPQQVADSVKKLIDECGYNGGYALGTALVLDHTTPENLHAMIDTAKEYGRYSGRSAG
jgi:hypothetical protein